MKFVTTKKFVEFYYLTWICSYSPNDFMISRILRIIIWKNLYFKWFQQESQGQELQEEATTPDSNLIICNHLNEMLKLFQGPVVNSFKTNQRVDKKKFSSSSHLFSIYQNKITVITYVCISHLHIRTVKLNYAKLYIGLITNSRNVLAQFKPSPKSRGQFYHGQRLSLDTSWLLKQLHLQMYIQTTFLNILTIWKWKSSHKNP